MSSGSSSSSCFVLIPKGRGTGVKYHEFGCDGRTKCGLVIEDCNFKKRGRGMAEKFFSGKCSDCEAAES